jgi:phosphoglycolate phosphatase
MHFQSVTFDLDGTLLDTIADLAEACRLMLDDIGAPQRTPAEVHSFVGKGMAVLVERCLTHDSRRRPSAACRHRILQAPLHRGQRPFHADLPGCARRPAGWQASGLKMGVVTNKPGTHRSAARPHGHGDFLRRDRFRRYTAHKKPHPEPILHACRLFGVRPDRNLHIGDSATTSTPPMPPVAGLLRALRLQRGQAGGQRRLRCASIRSACRLPASPHFQDL